MELADRITFIHPDDRVKTVRRGWVDPSQPLLKMHSSVVPSWKCTGMDVVAAEDDGTVIVAFTVSQITSQTDQQTKYPGQRYTVLA